MRSATRRGAWKCNAASWQGALSLSSSAILRSQFSSELTLLRSLILQCSSRAKRTRRSFTMKVTKQSCFSGTSVCAGPPNSARNLRNSVGSTAKPSALLLPQPVTIVMDPLDDCSPDRRSCRKHLTIVRETASKQPLRSTIMSDPNALGQTLNACFAHTDISVPKSEATSRASTKAMKLMTCHFTA